nr:MAG: wsv447-like protein [Metapenaeopsis lamellata majanivirus]
MEDVFKISSYDNGYNINSKGQMAQPLSLQQNIVMTTLVNDIIITKLTGQASIFQLGGLPGSGKTFVVKSLIKKLILIGMIDISQVLICCKNNMAVFNVFNLMNENGNCCDIKKRQLDTFHKIFAFPVIKISMDMKKTLSWCSNSVYDSLEIYANLELLIIDEYMTMKSSEIVYIDALFRIARYRPDIPFGGLTVIFLGDNRQNSAVLSNNDNLMIDDYDNDNNNHISNSESGIAREYVLQLFKAIFGEESHWSSSYYYEIAQKSMKKTKNLLMEINKKIEKTHKDINNHNISNDNDSGNISLEDCITNLYNLEKNKDFNQNRYTANILQELIQNIPNDENNEIQYVSYFAQISEKLPIEILISDCLGLRINDLKRIMRNNIYIKEYTNIVLSFIDNAFKDIVSSQREKFFVLPTMVEDKPGESQLSIPEREVLNILLNEGNDMKCIDKKYDFEELREIKTIVNSVLFKEGRDLEYLYFKIFTYYDNHINNLEQIKTKDEFVCYINKVWDSINMKTENDKNLNSSEDEEECNNYSLFYKKTENIPYRMKKTVEFQQIIKKWDQIFIGSKSKLRAKARFWFFLKELIKKEIVKQDNIMIDDKDIYLHEKHLETPYWVKTFTIPKLTYHNHNGYCLPAYSIYISLKAKSFVIDSLKRICINKHVLGLHYAMAIKDLTSTYSIVDSRLLSTITDPIDTLPVCDETMTSFLNFYFELLFQKIVKEYLFINENDVENNKRNIFSISDDKLLVGKCNKSKYSEQVKLLTTEMLSTILKNEKYVNNNNKDNKNESSNKKSFIEKVNQVKSNIIQRNINYKKKTTLISPNVTTTTTTTTTPTNSSDDNNNNKTNLDVQVNNDTNKSNIIVLTKTNNDKNEIAYLVTSVITERMKHFQVKQNIDSSLNMKTEKVNFFLFKTQYIIDGIIIPNNVYSINDYILSNIRTKYKIHKKISKKPYIQYQIDNQLKWNLDNNKAYKTILNKIKTDVTKLDELLLFKGQKVYFSHSNSYQIYNFGTDVPFVTFDKGTVTNIVIKCAIENSSPIVQVSVSIDRLGGKVAHISPFKYVQGKASILFLPLASLYSMTVFSCQGMTLKSCETLINPSRLTAQEIYVSLTRNDNVGDIKIVTKSKEEISRIANLKQEMYPDIPRLYPIGVFGKWFATLEENERKTNDIYAIQKYLLNKSDNYLSFNRKWFETVESQFESNEDCDIYSYLSSIGETYLKNPSDHLDILLQMSEEKLFDLFYTCFLSYINFNRTYGIKPPKGSKQFSDFLQKGSGPTDFKNRHPIYVSPVIPRKSMEKIFYDIFPHSYILAIYQIYANFIFLVYELINICNIDFAFFPSSSPLTHSSFGCSNETSLNWETKKYRNSEDCGWRKNKDDMNKKEDVYNQTIVKLGVGNKMSFEECGTTCNKRKKITEILLQQSHVASAVMYNLRKKVKLDEQNEIAGIGVHGSIAVTVNKQCFSESGYSYIDTNGTRYFIGNNINFFSLLCFNMKLAAACGAYKVKFPLLTIPNVDMVTSKNMLICGKARPFKTIQCVLYIKHYVKNEYNNNNNNLIFSNDHILKVTNGQPLSSIAFLWYEHIPNEIRGKDPDIIRELISCNNVGILKCIKILKRVNTLNIEICKTIQQSENSLIYISFRLK